MVRTKPPGLIYHPIYSQLELPFKHRYPIGKYQALYQALLELGVSAEQFTPSQIATTEQLLSVHDALYAEQCVFPRMAIAQ